MRPGTRVIRAGMRPRAQGEPFSGGVTFAGTYQAAGDPANISFTYGRYHNPTWSAFEEALCELEGGPALCFASGMAAVNAVFAVALHSGDTILLPSESYYTIRSLGEGFFGRMGIHVRKAKTAGNSQLQHLDGAKLLWLETPANPSLDVCDIALLVEAAHAKGVLVAVDNTTATVLGQTPLALGADFSVASDTKALTGHADLILGHVAVREKAWADKLQAWRNLTGAVPGPMEVWLAHRSLGTLEVRLSRQCESALAVARYFASRGDILGLRYPGLTSDPGHEIAARQMRYFGPIISFSLANRTRAERFLGACKLVTEATSFGSLHTSAERRARWGGDDVSEGFIRLSIGCEDVQDIIEDLAQALEKSALPA